MNVSRMRKTRAYRSRDDRTLAEPCFVAAGFGDRVLGLMGERGLAQGSGLWIAPCNSIHTFFMRFAIDAVYLDRGGKVLVVRRNVKPWRVDWPVFRAHSVLEIPGGAAGDLKEGEIVCIN